MIPAKRRSHRKVATDQPPVREVEVVYEAPQAREVFLAGDFNNWSLDALPLHRNGDGVWRAKLALAPGEHQYRFIVDGNWQDDPRALTFVANVFGSQNAVLHVG
jgi:1,4-alpha-glucan branching enzyme